MNRHAWTKSASILMGSQIDLKMLRVSLLQFFAFCGSCAVICALAGVFFGDFLGAVEGGFRLRCLMLFRIYAFRLFAFCGSCAVICASARPAASRAWLERFVKIFGRG
jgi:hypothetical protein